MIIFDNAEQSNTFLVISNTLKKKRIEKVTQNVTLMLSLLEMLKLSNAYFRVAILTYLSNAYFSVAYAIFIRYVKVSLC